MLNYDSVHLFSFERTIGGQGSVHAGLVSVEKLVASLAEQTPSFEGLLKLLIGQFLNVRSDSLV